MVSTPLDTLHLDTRDFRLMRVGGGAWAIDGSGWSFRWGPSDEGDSTAAIRRALDLGIDWIDTSVVPGLGDLQNGAEYFSPDDRPYVFAKCGLIFEEGDRAGEPRHSRWPASIRKECEAALRRLGVERVDLYQLRWPDVTDTRVEHALRDTMPSLAAHRIGLAWYSTSQVDFLPETLSRAIVPASAVVATWTLTSPGVAGAIVSAGSSGQIEGWVDAATLLLSRANFGEIATAIGRAGARRGPQIRAALAA
jgi:aryl-alcohol dehydrogenase-like predicted oxidoreductase